MMQADFRWIAGEGNHLMSCSKRLLDKLATGPACRTKDRNFHWYFTFSPGTIFVLIYSPSIEGCFPTPCGFAAGKGKV
jgi:hypothetical protein